MSGTYHLAGEAGHHAGALQPVAPSFVQAYARGPRVRRDNGWTIAYAVVMACVTIGGIAAIAIARSVANLYEAIWNPPGWARERKGVAYMAARSTSVQQAVNCSRCWAARLLQDCPGQIWGTVGFGASLCSLHPRKLGHMPWSQCNNGIVADLSLPRRACPSFSSARLNASCFPCMPMVLAGTAT
jgi:hypothetical protein